MRIGIDEAREVREGLRRLCCPFCGSWLLSIAELRGGCTLRAKCRNPKCRKEIEIEIEGD